MNWVLVIFLVWGGHQFSIQVPVATKALCEQAQQQADVDLVKGGIDPKSGIGPAAIMTCLQTRENSN